jgi:hypothetical protein
MLILHCCALLVADHFVSGKVLHVIGICVTMRAAWYRSLGATRSLLLERSRWLTASLFTPTISIALWAALRLLRNQVGSMAGGSLLIYLGHLRVVLAAAVGNRDHNATPYSA